MLLHDGHYIYLTKIDLFFFYNIYNLCHSRDPDKSNDTSFLKSVQPFELHTQLLHSRVQKRIPQNC